MPYNFSVLPASYATPAAVILAVGGLLACFAGYRLFRFVLGLYGFILGAMITTGMMGGTTNKWTLVLAAIVGGLAGAGLMVAAYFVGVGLIGALLAALGLNAVWHFVGGDPPTVLLVVVCVLGALGALSVVRYVVVFGTAVSGAWTLIIGVFALMGDKKALLATSANDIWVLYPRDPLPGQWWVTLLWFGLALAGVVVQLSTTTKMGKAKVKTPPKTR